MQLLLFWRFGFHFFSVIDRTQITPPEAGRQDCQNLPGLFIRVYLGYPGDLCAIKNMNKYLHWNRKNISDFSELNISSLYDEGYVFTRRGKGVMDQTRSIRIDLEQFEMSSENKRILRKTEEVKLKIESLPYSDYHWSIGKLAKDFYDEKFGNGTFSANKVRELLVTDESNFNRLFIYKGDTGDVIAYSICYENESIIHYSYPFYALGLMPYVSMGMGMMLRAICYAKDNGKKYIYLGSAQRSTDTYKFQFKGLEWFSGSDWKDDFGELKEILSK